MGARLLQSRHQMRSTGGGEEKRGLVRTESLSGVSRGSTGEGAYAASIHGECEDGV